MPLKDVNVIIDLVKPAPKIGLGTPLILVEAVGAPAYKEYLSLEALATDYASGTAVHAKAQTILAQKNRPAKVAVASYEAGAVDAALDTFYNRAWHFALLAENKAADQLDVANLVAGKDFKFFVAQVDGNTGREALAGKKRTIIVDHDVAAHFGHATEPIAFFELALTAVVRLAFTARGQRFRLGFDVPLRKVADARRDLAATTDATSTADRVEIDTQTTGSIEDGDPLLYLGVEARWRKDDAWHDASVSSSER